MKKEELKTLIKDTDLSKEENFNNLFQKINEDQNRTLAERDETIKNLKEQNKKNESLVSENERLQNTVYIARKNSTLSDDEINDALTLAKTKVNESTNMEQALDLVLGKYFKVPEQPKVEKPVVEPKTETPKPTPVVEQPKPKMATPRANISTAIEQSKTEVDDLMDKLGLGKTPLNIKKMLGQK